MLKKSISFILVLLLLIVFSVPVSASTEVNTPSLEMFAKGAVLMDMGSGKILYEKNGHKKLACASITKVMTLTLVMEALDSGKLKLDEMLTSSAHAASMGGSDIWLEEGERMSVDDLIKATAVASANDAAVVLAEKLCGSEDVFVSEMNKKAKKLGMNDTTFKNCNGLDEEGHLTSAYDVALMSRELCTHKKIFDYTSIWLDNLRGGKTQIVNTNKLLRTYNGITGLKTGTTNDAGCCMSATAEREGLSLCAVVLGCETGTSRFADAANLLDYGFANYRVEQLTLPKEANSKVKVSGGMTDEVKLVCENPGNMVVHRATDSKLTRECKIKKDISAPIKKGQKLGEVNFYSGKDLIKSCAVKACSDVEEMTFGSVIHSVINSLFKQ